MFRLDIFIYGTYLYLIYVSDIYIYYLYLIFKFDIHIHILYFPLIRTEPKPLHIVNTTLDMPEGVTLSDSEDKDGKYDPNDPHRALDIELDM